MGVIFRYKDTAAAQHSPEEPVGPDTDTDEGSRNATVPETMTQHQKTHARAKMRQTQTKSGRATHTQAKNRKQSPPQSAHIDGKAPAQLPQTSQTHQKSDIRKNRHFLSPSPTLKITEGRSGSYFPMQGYSGRAA